MSKKNIDLYNSIFWKDKGFFSWKGKTFNQVTTILQKNKGILPTRNSMYFQPMPLKIYRREIASVTPTRCYPRTQIKIDELNRPNGYLLYGTSKTAGLNSTLEMQIPSTSYELNTPTCNTKTNCMSQSSNALRRVRSAGMNRKKYNSCTNSDVYNANTEQYLKSRNMTFQQNQLVHKNQKSIFKPSNKRFNAQGGVESSSLINKIKYDTLIDFGASLKSKLGFNNTHSLAYAVPKEGYKKKLKPFPLLDEKLLSKIVLQKCK